jgi:U3 small nucleolar RNA-associated protein 14
MITKLSQEELVRRAFAAPSDKEVEDDFRKEKEDMALEDDPTRKAKKAKAASQEEVAGWGSWTGAGALAPPPPRRLPKKLQAPTKKKGDPNKRKRKDDKKPDVIINQKRMKKTANGYMLGDVPHPYSSRAEYEQAMLGGVGKEWNVTSAFKNMTRPEIMTRSGKIIQPISKKAKAARPAAKF